MKCQMCQAEIHNSKKCAECGYFNETPDSTGGLIPYKNTPALVAYYLGIFSLIPCLGMPLGIAAVVSGIIGLRAYKRQPVIKGATHAWIGIVLGFITSAVWGLALALMTIGSIFG